MKVKKVLKFLDDGFACDSSFENTSTINLQIKNYLLKSGFVPKVDKCTWIPVQMLQFLGNKSIPIRGSLRSRTLELLKLLIPSMLLC